MLKIALIGAGKLGKIHIDCLKSIDKYDIKGFFDTNVENSKNVEKKYGIKYFPDVEQLIDSVDVVDVVTPTLSHIYYAKKAIQKNKHVFIEKPVTNNLIELKQLINLSKSKPNIKIQWDM